MKFRDPYDCPRIEIILKTAPKGLDPDLLADDIGVTGFSAMHVRAYQRRLGLRQIAENSSRGERRYAIDQRGRKKKQKPDVEA